MTKFKRLVGGSMPICAFKLGENATATNIIPDKCVKFAALDN